MDTSTLKTHPLMVIAATTVILTCLLAIGIMTGVISSPLTRDRTVAEESAADAKRADANESRRTAANDSRRAAAKQSAAPVGSTASSAPSSAVSNRIAAVCNNCGTITSVRTVKRQGEAGVVGPLAGGAIGGIVGSQIGGGSGKTLATIAGAAGGAAIGTEVERRSKSTVSYVVGVRLNDGITRSFTYGSAPGVQEGDKVKVVDGRLVRDS
jgi:outer membrane lipoprotein SlyB